MCDPVYGFAVSPYPDRSRTVDPNAEPADLLRSLQAFIAANRDLLSKPGYYVGAWHDPDVPIYLDVSVVTDTAEAARELALGHDQIAFFDFQTFTSAVVNREATSGQQNLTIPERRLA